MVSEIEPTEVKCAQSVLVEKGIYKYSKSFPQGTGNGIPNHYHVCVKIDNTVALLSCGTSQHGNVESRTLYFGWKYVDIDPTTANGFSEKTHIPCDKMFEISQGDFDNYYKQGMIEMTGTLSEEEYQAILEGIRRSKRMPTEEKNRILGTD